MKWFKFYGQDFQTDPKIGYLTTPQKLMWVNLLCIASQDEEHTGIIKFLTESHLKAVSGITDNPINDDWVQSKNTFEVFERLGLIKRPDEVTIVIPKFKEKQETLLTDAERSKKYRNKKKNEANNKDSHNIVTEPSQERHTRIDKIREDNIYNNDAKVISPPARSKENSLKEKNDEQNDKRYKAQQLLKAISILVLSFFLMALPSHAVEVKMRYKIKSTYASQKLPVPTAQSPKGNKISNGTDKPATVGVASIAKNKQLLTDQDIAAYIKSKGWDYSTAIRLAKSENFWNLTKSFDCSRVGAMNRDGSYDYGIFQINSIHASRLASLGMTMEDMKDCKKNIDFAYEWIYSYSGFQPWSAYINGSYLSHSEI